MQNNYKDPVAFTNWVKFNRQKCVGISIHIICLIFSIFLMNQIGEIKFCGMKCYSTPECNATCMHEGYEKGICLQNDYGSLECCCQGNLRSNAGSPIASVDLTKWSFMLYVLSVIWIKEIGQPITYFYMLINFSIYNLTNTKKQLTWKWMRTLIRSNAFCSFRLPQQPRARG